MTTSSTCSHAYVDGDPDGNVDADIDANAHADVDADFIWQQRDLRPRDSDFETA